MSKALFVCFDNAIVNAREILTVTPYRSSSADNAPIAGMKVDFKSQNTLYLPGVTVEAVAKALGNL